MIINFVPLVEIHQHGEHSSFLEVLQPPHLVMILMQIVCEISEDVLL